MVIRFSLLPLDGDVSFYKQAKGSPERFRNLLKLTQLMSGGEGGIPLVFCLLSKAFFHQIMLQVTPERNRLNYSFCSCCFPAKCFNTHCICACLGA